jgi:circadian clock protein KaiB
MINEGEGNLLNWDDNEEPVYQLRLFVTGASPVSIRAINNLQTLLDEHLNGRYELEIIDAHQQPLLVKSENITAVPCLIKIFPLPQRRLVGDMSNTERVLRGLGLL